MDEEFFVKAVGLKNKWEGRVFGRLRNDMMQKGYLHIEHVISVSAQACATTSNLIRQLRLFQTLLLCEWLRKESVIYCSLASLCGGCVPPRAAVRVTGHCAAFSLTWLGFRCVPRDTHPAFALAMTDAG